MMKIILPLFLIFVLTACDKNPDGSTIVGMPGSPAWRKTAAPELVAEHYGKRCSSYGFKAGTDAMAGCIQSEISGDSQRQSDNTARLQADIARAFEPKKPTSIRCSSYRYTANSTSTNCNSY